jgi:hypothetical protein
LQEKMLLDRLLLAREKTRRKQPVLHSRRTPSLEELNRLLMLFGGSAAFERSKISALSGLRVFLPRI